MQKRHPYRCICIKVPFIFGLNCIAYLELPEMIFQCTLWCALDQSLWRLYPCRVFARKWSTSPPSETCDWSTDEPISNIGPAFMSQIKNSSHAMQTSRQCNQLQALQMIPKKYITVNQLAQSFLLKYWAVIPWMILLSSWLCRHMLAMLAFLSQMLRHLQQFASSQSFCPLLWKSPPTLKQETWWREILTPTGRKLACLIITLDMLSIHHLKMA